MSFRATRGIRAYCLLPIALCLAMLAACGGQVAPSNPASTTASAVGASPAGGASASAKPAASGATKITVGLSQTIPQFLPAWVGKDAGVYARHGLDVDQRIGVATTIMASLLANELSLAVTGGPETLNATANGADLVVVGNIAPVAALKFEVAPNIKSDQDLVGKKLGVTRLGSTTHSNTRALLSRLGLNPDKDVTYVQLNDSPTEAASLIAGQIDGALLAPPENTKVEGQGFRMMYDLSELKFPATGQIIVMPRAWLNAHRDTAQQYVDSIVDATALLRRDKSVGTASLQKNMKLDDPQVQSSVYDYFAAHILAPQPYMQPEQLANDLQVVQQASGKLKDFDVNKIIDNSLVKSAVDRGLDKV